MTAGKSPAASGAASAGVKSRTSIRRPMLNGLTRVSSISSAGVAVPNKQNVTPFNAGSVARPT